LTEQIIGTLSPNNKSLPTPVTESMQMKNKLEPATRYVC
jgi:hypothetical protein